MSQNIGDRRIIGEQPEETAIRERLQTGLQSYNPQLSQPELQARSAYAGQLNRSLDPYQQPGFKDIVGGIQRAGQESLLGGADVINSGLAQYGQFGSSSVRNQLMRDLAERTALGTQEQIAGYAFPAYQNNLNRQASLIPYGQQFGNVERSFRPLQFQAQQQALGLAGTPRQYQQAQQDAILKGQLDRLNSYNQASGILSQSIKTPEFINEPSLFQEVGAPILMALGTALGGPIGGAAGAGLGSAFTKEAPIQPGGPK